MPKLHMIQEISDQKPQLQFLKTKAIVEERVLILMGYQLCEEQGLTFPAPGNSTFKSPPFSESGGKEAWGILGTEFPLPAITISLVHEYTLA